MNRIWKLSLVIATLILVDQFSKGAVQSSFQLGESIEVIPNFFHLTYVRNSGAAFGFGAGSHDWFRIGMFLALPVLACFWLLYLMWQERRGCIYLASAYALIFSGAVGNLIDRFTLRYVVDFLDFQFGSWHFWTFNIADSAITIGAGFLIVGLYLENKRKALGTEVRS